MKNLLNKIEFFYKFAGLLAVPAQMENKILDLIKQSFENHLVSGQNKYDYEVNIDLSGLPNNYNPGLLEKLEKNFGPIKLLVKIIDKAEALSLDRFKGRPIAGYWSAHRRELFVEVANLDGKYNSQYAASIVRHELSHMMQTFIETLIMHKNTKKNYRSDYTTFRAKPGYPSEWRPSQQFETENKKYKENPDYYMSSGIEFFSQLRDQIEAYQESGYRTKYHFLRFVKTNPFMANLKNEKPRLYERAVKEAWRIFEKNLDTNPESEVEGKKSLEMAELFSKSKKDMIEFAQKVGFDNPIPIDQLPDYLQALIASYEPDLKMGKPSDFMFFEKDGDIIGTLVSGDHYEPLMILKDPYNKKKEDPIKDEAVRLLNQNKEKIIEYAKEKGFNKEIVLSEMPDFLKETITAITKLPNLDAVFAIKFKKLKSNKMVIEGYDSWGRNHTLARIKLD